MAEKRVPKVRMDPSLDDRLFVGALVQQGIEVSEEAGEALDRALDEAQAEMRALYGKFQPSEIPGLAPARALFRSIGVDPTRMRPASEALLRRILKGGAIPRINSAVDAANLVSLRHLIPVGLYDCGRIEGDVEIRVGRPGEEYQRIGEGMLHLEGRLGLFDAKGGFGNPTGDSRRTCVRPGIESLLFVAFFPSAFEPAAATGMLQDARAMLGRHCGGESVLLGGNGLIRGREAA